MRFWYRGSTLDTLNDGDAVSSWTDLSGNGFHQTQSGGSRPVLKKNILKAKSVVRFDGTDDYLRNASVTATQPNTTYIVVAGGSGTYAAYDSQTNQSTRQNFFYISGALSAFAGSQVTSATTVGTGFVKATVSYDNTAGYIRKNGVPYASGTIGTNSLGGTAGLLIGAVLNDGGNPFLFFAGDVAELIGFNGRHTEAQVRSVERYFLREYGV